MIDWWIYEARGFDFRDVWEWHVNYWKQFKVRKTVYRLRAYSLWREVSIRRMIPKSIVTGKMNGKRGVRKQFSWLRNLRQCNDVAKVPGGPFSDCLNSENCSRRFLEKMACDCQRAIQRTAPKEKLKKKGGFQARLGYNQRKVIPELSIWKYFSRNIIFSGLGRWLKFSVKRLDG